MRDVCRVRFFGAAHRPMSVRAMTVSSRSRLALGPLRVLPSPGLTLRPLIGLAIPVALAVVWEVAVRLGLAEGRLVPPPSTILATFGELGGSGELSRHAFATVTRVAAGFGLGVACGTVFAAV